MIGEKKLKWELIFNKNSSKQLCLLEVLLAFFFCRRQGWEPFQSILLDVLFLDSFHFFFFFFYNRVNRKCKWSQPVKTVITWFKQYMRGQAVARLNRSRLWFCSEKGRRWIYFPVGGLKGSQTFLAVCCWPLKESLCCSYLVPTGKLSISCVHKRCFSITSFGN